MISQSGYTENTESGPEFREALKTTFISSRTFTASIAQCLSSVTSVPPLVPSV